MPVELQMLQPSRVVGCSPGAGEITVKVRYASAGHCSTLLARSDRMQRTLAHRLKA